MNRSRLYRYASITVLGSLLITVGCGHSGRKGGTSGGIHEYQEWPGPWPTPSSSSSLPIYLEGLGTKGAVSVSGKPLSLATALSLHAPPAGANRVSVCRGKERYT